MFKLVTIVGARPQFIKAAVLSKIIKEDNKIDEVIIHTGQHFDKNMSSVFFEEMNIPKPAYNLDINSMSHGAMTGAMLQKIEEVLLKEKPDAVLVYGDTNSTLAGALAAKKIDCKVIHVEAGLRSFNMKMPEEINRILTDRISDLLFCPTEVAVSNLKKEGFDHFSSRVVKTGDIMKDSVEYFSNIADANSDIMKRLNLHKDDFILTTIHREENTNPVTLQKLFSALEEVNKFKKVVIPLHPRTKKILTQHNLTFDITFIEPLGYLDMLQLLQNCYMVVTDSGGLQKEAYFLGKYSVVVRNETEWVELIENGFAKLVGNNTSKLLETIKEIDYKKLVFTTNLYGENVGEKIYNEILKLR